MNLRWIGSCGAGGAGSLTSGCPASEWAIWKRSIFSTKIGESKRTPMCYAERQLCLP